MLNDGNDELLLEVAKRIETAGYRFMDFIPLVPRIGNDIGRSSVIVLAGENDKSSDELTVEEIMKEMFNE